MRHRLAKQLLLAELDADPLLQIAQPLEFGLAERRRGQLGRGCRWRRWQRLGRRRRRRRSGSD
ncbi:MAG: hypothetical protein ABSC35_09535 [Candidatus Dormibacteria bacterium]